MLFILVTRARTCASQLMHAMNLTEGCGPLDVEGELQRLAADSSQHVRVAAVEGLNCNSIWIGSAEAQALWVQAPRPSRPFEPSKAGQALWVFTKGLGSWGPAKMEHKGLFAVGRRAPCHVRHAQHSGEAVQKVDNY